MVDKIYQLKNAILQELEKAAHDKGADRLDGDMVDMVKDLACAEKDCWEAEYYRNVVEAMDGAAGYSPMGYQPAQGGQANRMGWQNQYGSGRGGRRGYDGSYGYQDPLEAVRSAMQGAAPEERERMKGELRKLAGM